MKKNDLKGIIVKNGITQQDVARMLGITPKTFYSKMKTGVFTSEEIKVMISKLNIDNPMDIFFSE